MNPITISLCLICNRRVEGIRKKSGKRICRLRICRSWKRKKTFTKDFWSKSKTKICCEREREKTVRVITVSESVVFVVYTDKTENEYEKDLQKRGYEEGGKFIC